MRLEDKGKIVPPPVLSQYPEVVSKEIQEWDAIISATHWEIHNNNEPNGSDFYVGAAELGHIHLDGMLHLPSTKAFSKLLIEAKIAQKFIYGQNWIQFKIHNQASAAQAIWIFRLHYDRLCGIDDAEIAARILDFKS